MTEPPGWASPMDEPEAGQPGPATPPGSAPQGQPPVPPPGWGPPPGYGDPAPGAPYGTAPPGSFGSAGYGTYGPGGYGQAGYGGQAGVPAGWGRAAAPEPGIVPLRPLGLGEILDGGFAVVRKYPGVTLGLSAIVVAVTTLLSTALQLYDANRVANDPEVGGIPVGTIAGFTLRNIGIVLLAGMLTSVMGEAVLGRSTTIGQTWAKVRSRAWALVGAALLGGIVPVLGLFLCVAPGVFLWGAWAFLTPVVVLERAGPITAIRRSYRLAVPDFWRVWGIRALAFLIAAFISYVIVIPATLAAYGTALFDPENFDFGIVQVTIVTLASIVAGTVTAPFSAGVLSLLYIDRRMRAEGLDVTLAQAAQQPVA